MTNHTVSGNLYPEPLSTEQKLVGCLAAGALGDALGSRYEGLNNITSVQPQLLHGITDDTQLTYLLPFSLPVK